MNMMPDSSDRMPSPPDSFAVIKIKQAYKLLQDATKSPTFNELHKLDQEYTREAISKLLGVRFVD